MRRIETLVIGAGQAGLAMSRCLTDRGAAHVVLERGEVANAWAAQRWDSLRLLTPNWQSRLPGQVYDGPDPDGYMTAAEAARYLADYAARSAAPVETRTQVFAVEADGTGYLVRTDRGDWVCRNLVLATGACAVAQVPAWAEAAPPSVRQFTALNYRSPAQLPEGPILVVGASASGVQIAAEVRASGREVVLSTGHHVRTPRRYRGRDIQWWMDRSGMHDVRYDAVDDIDRARRVPSLQLVGSSDILLLDLNALRAAGVDVAGRLAGFRDGQALFSGSLANACAMSDLKMHRLLAGFDAWAESQGLAGLPAPERFAPTEVPAYPRLSLDLSGVAAVIWATGYRPDFSWLHLPVFDPKGRLRHDGGHVAPGLYVLGLPFLRRRKSGLLDGVGADAQDLADHLVQTRGRLAA